MWLSIYLNLSIVINLQPLLSNSNLAGQTKRWATMVQTKSVLSLFLIICLPKQTPRSLKAAQRAYAEENAKNFKNPVDCLRRHASLVSSRLVQYSLVSSSIVSTRWPSVCLRQPINHFVQRTEGSQDSGRCSLDGLCDSNEWTRDGGSFSQASWWSDCERLNKWSAQATKLTYCMSSSQVCHRSASPAASSS